MNVGFIPLRKGSKGIHKKNHKILLGRPLFSWVLYEAVKSSLDKVFIYTDDEFIKNFIKREYANIDKIDVMDRSSESASDIATTEFALWEFCEKIDFNFDNILLIQATSPLLDYKSIDKCVKTLSNGFDSCLTVTPIKRFFWNKSGKPINYNYLQRSRRQELHFDYVENGACYAINKNTYLKSKNRLGGKIALVEMEEDSYTEIDEYSDFLILEALISKKIRNSGTLSKIKLLCLDVDGVLTDATAIYTKDGELGKSFSLVDGKGLELLRNAGVNLCIITSEHSDVVRSRIKKLNITNAFFGVKDKYYILDSFIRANNYSWKEVAYIGDDINDLTNIIAAGISFCPNNSSDVIKSHSNIVLSKSGGNGAVREACDIIIKSKIQ